MSLRRLRAPAAAVFVAAIALSSGCGGGTATPAVAKHSTDTSSGSTVVPAGLATADVIAQLVAASTGITKVPADLTPALADLPSDSENVYKDGCQAQDADSTVGACVYGDRAGSHTVVLLGDSHAGMWLPAFDSLGQRAHWKVVLLSKPGCPAPDISFFNLQQNRSYPECDKWHGYVTDRINRLHPDEVVVASAYFKPKLSNQQLVTPAQWTAGLTDTLKGITAPGARKVVLGDIAYLDQSAPECLAAHQSSVQNCATPAATAVKIDHQQAEQAAATAAGASYVDVTRWLCAKTCPPIVGNMAVYRNQFHITTVYARWLASALQTELQIPVS